MSLSALLRQQSKRFAHGFNLARVAHPTTPATVSLRALSTSSFLQQQQRWGLRQDRDGSSPRYQQQDRGGFAADSDPSFTPRSSFRRQNPPSSSLYVGNLPYTIESSEVENAFARYGAITEIRMAHSPDGRFKGFAHVEFANESDVVQLIEATQEQPIYVQNRQLRLDYGVAKRPSAKRTEEPYHVLHVFKFPGQTHDLVNAFSEFGVKASDISAMKDRETGELAGKFWIEMGSIEKATEALEKLHDTQTADGYQLRVAFGRPRPAPTRYGGEWGGEKKNQGYKPRRSFNRRDQGDEFGF